MDAIQAAMISQSGLNPDGSAKEVTTVQPFDMKAFTATKGEWQPPSFQNIGKDIKGAWSDVKAAFDDPVTTFKNAANTALDNTTAAVQKSLHIFDTSAGTTAASNLELGFQSSALEGDTVGAGLVNADAGEVMAASTGGEAVAAGAEGAEAVEGTEAVVEGAESADWLSILAF